MKEKINLHKYVYNLIDCDKNPNQEICEQFMKTNNHINL